MSFIGYRTIKTAIGVIIALYIANFLNLQYYTASGIIVILSLQNTKKRSYHLAYQRIISFILAIILAILIFYFLGYNAMSFGVFILLFIPLSVKFKLVEGIVVNSVLMTHLLIEQSIAGSLLFNEFLLMLIGVMVALVLNLHMPSNEKTIREELAFIDERIKIILFDMSKSLKEQIVSLNEEDNFNQLEERLKKAEKHAMIYMNNNFTKEHYYLAYSQMRFQQFMTLKKMREHFQYIFMTYTVTLTVSEFTKEVGNSINVVNNASDLLSKLNNLRTSFKALALPNTREEFENRAMLYQFLNDLEVFLNIKNTFHIKYKEDKII